MAWSGQQAARAAAEDYYRRRFVGYGLTPPEPEPDRCCISWCSRSAAATDPDGLCERCRENVDSWKVA